MALVEDIRIVQKERQHVHRPTECSASVISVDGKRYLQLDTYGSADRQDRGKLSQSVQLSENAAAQLRRLIGEIFPQLR